MGAELQVLWGNSLPRPSFYPLYTLHRDHIPVFKGYKEGPGKDPSGLHVEKIWWKFGFRVNGLGLKFRV